MANFSDGRERLRAAAVALDNEDVDLAWELIEDARRATITQGEELQGRIQEGMRELFLKDGSVPLADFVARRMWER